MVRAQEGLTAAIAARLKNFARDEIIVFADPAKQRLAGNLMSGRRRSLSRQGRMGSS